MTFSITGQDRFEALDQDSTSLVGLATEDLLRDKLADLLSKPDKVSSLPENHGARQTKLIQNLTFDGHPTFKPPSFMSNKHLQTVWGVHFRETPEINTDTIQLPLSDGDSINLRHCDAGSSEMIIILHGLTGSNQANYILSMQKALYAQNLSSIAMTYRGADNNPNRQTKAYHAGQTQDFHEVLAYVQQLPNIENISALGFSLGANILLKALGERPNLPLTSAAAISPPFDLAACADHMDNGIPRLYRNYLLARLKKRFLAKRAYFQSEGHTDWPIMAKVGSLKHIRSFWSFDNFVVAPIEGFRNVHHYYLESSSKHFLRYIQVPTLIVHALDDPLIPASCTPSVKEVSDQVVLETHANGGHQGFVQFKNNSLEYWLESRIPHFFRHSR